MPQPPPAWLMSLIALALAGAIVIRAHQVKERLRGLPLALPLLAYAGVYGYVWLVPGDVGARVTLVRSSMLALLVAWLLHYAWVISEWLWKRQNT